ncbi:MAG: hypothetical protein WKF78_02540 [Candidatus Limnocylindrales bacterium]
MTAEGLGPVLHTIPSTDAAFREHVERVADRERPRQAPELERRLRRLFPRVRVRERSLSGERVAWYIYRDGGWVPPDDAPWWVDAGLARVRHDLDGLILDALRRPGQFLGDDIVGRHWQDLTTPGAAPRVAEFMAIIEQLGTVVSRFRMPSASGSLVEFDSFTQVEGSSVVTIMRPLSRTRQTR